ncbi:ATP phosphoribosyltransferase regulatory subunit [Orrella marina]|uniref:ATP phosphoribosyltransferase regulatory subunit n=1 Tax=Orrella marina TaxID=2163011 RepID=A0A2R4XI69_9BURK|nr:ATP phosphoribosyltransferase regulatory subunit [Orrella marina]AWB33495.1 ATP phosphoribosyltransferase regulatory subunit [Orrella marina]
MNGHWLLPEHLADVLPAEARRVEELRRSLLDLFRTYGFETVSAPMVEYLDSLLAGAGEDLRLRTFKLVDQLSGRTLGLRADMTPQATRIDAHLLNRQGVTRLCYCGPVLHTRPNGLLASRELLQIGAEIYGYSGFQADLEIIRLAIATLSKAGITNSHLVLCHDGLIQAIINSDSAAVARADEIISLLRDKDLPGISGLADIEGGLLGQTVEALHWLARLNGGVEVLESAREHLPPLPEVTQALQTLEALLAGLDMTSLSIDLADAGQYGYHSGVTFMFYAPNWHDALVRGGRYDNISMAYGRARAATGFSLDLRRLAALLEPAAPVRAVLAPAGYDAELNKSIDKLRDSGEIVVQLLPHECAEHAEFEIDRELANVGGRWIVRPLN